MGRDRHGRRIAVLRAAAVLAVLAVACVVVGRSPVEAAFSGTTGNSNRLTAAADFEAGSLRTWGDTFAHVDTPLQIGASTDWATGAQSGWVNNPVSDCAVKTTGTLWCWGTNAQGQLGLGDTTARQAPTQVGTASNWTGVDTGVQSACATNSDGQIWCWGTNPAGLGTASAYTTSPLKVTTPSDTGWTQVSVGWASYCGIRSDTSLYCWGDNSYGVVGDGTRTGRGSPTAVTSPAATGWTSVFVGDRHVCATRSGNQVWCWGEGQNGKLGIGSTTDSLSPAQVSGTTWASVSSGRNSTCATKTDGSLWCWGGGGAGQIGNGVIADATSPVQVGSATTWQAVALSQNGVCATRTDSTLWCWGSNTYGQAGDSSTLRRATPVQITSPATDGWRLTLGGVTADRICATRTGGTLWCWGYAVGPQTTVRYVDASTTWRKPASGLDFSCALRTSGALYCWGAGTSGQLGDGTTMTRADTPAQVGTVTTWTSVTAGKAHACGTRADGTLWCWGSNATGQLGVGSTTAKSSPTQVTSPSTSGWSQVSAGADSTCAVRTDGALYCWGNDANGQLGDGAAAAQQTAPVQVAPSTGWTSVRVGASFACGLRSDALFCWGLNGAGQLGDGTATQQSTPVPVSGSWTTFATGTLHACAIATAGTMWCWGNGGNGRLGTGSTSRSTTPAQVGTDATWRTVTAGATSTCATRTGPTVWCWGGNQYGQLATGDTVDVLTPQQLVMNGRPVETGSTGYTGVLVSAR